MLCKVNLNPSANATTTALTFNFMSVVGAIATAAAGTTPTCQPVNPTTGNRMPGYEMITSVLSNAEAGGWSQTTTTAASSTTVVTPTSSPGVATIVNATARYVMNLYKDSGKNSYLHYSMGNLLGAYWNAQAGSPTWTNNPDCAVNFGHAATIDPADSAYYFGTSQASTYQWGGSSLSESYQTNGTYFKNTAPYCLDQMSSTALQNVYIAATAQYIIIAFTNDSLLYYGLRPFAAWEQGRSDNPYWYGFQYTNRTYAGWGNGTNTSYHMDNNGGWSALINNSGVQTAATRYAKGSSFTGTSSNYSAGSSLTSWRGNLGQSGYNSGFSEQINSYGFSLPFTMLVSEMYGPYNLGNGFSTSTFFDGIITDTTTGLQVPPAYPINANFNYQGKSAAGGQIPGILRGMASSDITGYNNYVTASEYVIGSDTYIPVFTGNATYKDLFFLKKS